MAEALTEVSEFTDDVTVPQPGDKRTAQSVRVGFQPLANRTRLHQDTAIGNYTPGALSFTSGTPGTDPIDIPPTSMVTANSPLRTIPAQLRSWIQHVMGLIPGYNVAGLDILYPPIGMIGPSNSATWSQIFGGSGVPVLNQVATSSIQCPIWIPWTPGVGKITAVSIQILPHGGHSALPAVKPRLFLKRWVLAGGDDGDWADPEDICDKIDDSSAVEDYEIEHSLLVEAVDFDSPAIIGSGLYYIMVQGESSTNSVAGLQYGPMTVTYEQE